MANDRNYYTDISEPVSVIQNSIYSTVDTIVQQRISEIPIDKTILCTVKTANGTEYTVTYDNLTLSVTGEKDAYSEGTKVYVLIPNGDFSSKEKSIINKYVAAEDTTPADKYLIPSKALALASEPVLKITDAMSINVTNDGIFSSVVDHDEVSFKSWEVPETSDNENFPVAGNEFELKKEKGDSYALGTFGSELSKDEVYMITGNIKLEGTTPQTCLMHGAPKAGESGRIKLPSIDCEPNQFVFFRRFLKIPNNFAHSITRLILGTTKWEDGNQGFIIKNLRVVKLQTADVDKNIRFGYDAISMKTSFNTQGLNECTAGSYGIRAYLLGCTWDGTLVNSQEFNLNSKKDIFGNSYAFDEVFFKQEQVYAYSDIERIDKGFLAFELYQDGKFEGASTDAKITIQNTTIHFGNYMTKEKNETLKIFVQGESDYNTDINDVKRNLRLVWYVKDEYGQYLNDFPQPDKTTLIWQQDKGDGNWVDVETATSLSEGQKYTITLPEDQIESHVRAVIKVVEKVETEEDNNEAETEEKTTEYISNTITFTNQSQYALRILQTLNGLSIVHGVNSASYNNYYNATGALKAGVNDKISRSVKIQYTEPTEDSVAYASEADFKNCVAYWYIPKELTMLMGVGTILTKDNASDEDKKMLRAGYFCYKKQFEIDITTTDEEGKQKTVLTEESKSFNYKIKSFYSPQYSNNKITCVIKNPKTNETFEKSIDLQFSYESASGTKYGFAFNFPNGEPGYIYNKDTTLWQPLDMEVTLYNPEGQALDSDITITCICIKKGQSLDSTNAGLYIKKSTDENNDSQTTLTVPSGTRVTLYGQVVFNSYCLITVQAKIATGTTISSTYGLPLTYGVISKNWAYTGETPTTIYYNSAGTNPSFYRDIFQLMAYNLNKQRISGPSDYTRWRICKLSKGAQAWNFISSTSTSYNENEDVKLYKDDGKSQLQIPPLCLDNYINGSTYYMLQCISGSGADLQIFYTQPLIFTLDEYTNSIVNDWDGKLTIDEDGNSILASMIGAGFKSENKFTGVLMGKVGQTTGAPLTGLFGYNEGKQSFSFDTNGTATLGIANRGQIIFDGTKGIIQSAKYDAVKKTGTYIDLDNGEFYFGQKEETDAGKKPSYIAYQNNKLKIVADEFELTSANIDTPNLIRNTAPVELDDVVNGGVYDKGIAYWTGFNITKENAPVYAYKSNSGKKRILFLPSTQTEERASWGKIKFYSNDAGTYSVSYDISGNYAGNSEPGTDPIQCRSDVRSSTTMLAKKIINIKTSTDNLHSVHYTVDLEANQEYTLYIGNMKSTVNGYGDWTNGCINRLFITNLQVYEGNQSREWRPHEDDHINMNEFLSTFNQLTQNGKQDGMFLKNNTLCINATFISTGILKSNKNNIKFDLDEGLLVANNLSISAQSDNNKLILNNAFNEKDKEYFYVGNDDAHIKFASDKDGNKSLNILMGNNEGFGCQLTSTGFSLSSKSKEVFKCDKKGVEITGKITADSGTIGGWIASSQMLRKNYYDTTNAINYSVMMRSKPSSTDSYAFAVYSKKGDEDTGAPSYSDGWKSQPFYVTYGGKLHAENAEITGTIKATSGEFKGDVMIGTQKISSWINEGGNIYKINATSGTIGNWYISAEGIANAEQNPTLLLQANRIIYYGSGENFSRTITWPDLISGALHGTIASIRFNKGLEGSYYIPIYPVLGTTNPEKYMMTIQDGLITGLNRV